MAKSPHLGVGQPKIRCHILACEQLTLVIVMRTLPQYQDDAFIEMGRLLQQARTQQNLPIEAMCKKMGLGVEQLEAVENGDVWYFKNTTQAFLWIARLYAKKLSIDLPAPVGSDGQAGKIQTPDSSQEAPLFFWNTFTSV
jgi:hypothetical protein